MMSQQGHPIAYFGHKLSKSMQQASTYIAITQAGNK